MLGCFTKNFYHNNNGILSTVRITVQKDELFQLAPPVAENDSKVDGMVECRFLATGGRTQLRGFATGVGSKADIGAPPLIQLSFMSTRARASSTFVESHRLLPSVIGRGCGLVPPKLKTLQKPAGSRRIGGAPGIAASSSRASLWPA